MNLTQRTSLTSKYGTNATDRSRLRNLEAVVSSVVFVAFVALRTMRVALLGNHA